MTVVDVPRTSRMRRALLVFAGVLLALFLQEFLGRILLGDNWSPEDGLSSNALVLTEGGIHALRPDLERSTFAAFSHRTPLFTDELGCRVPGPGHERPEDPIEEILVIGASNTWGMGVPAEHSWPFVFEKIMEEKGHALRVHNASGVGYSLPMMLARAKELTDRRAFDQVLLVTPSSGLYMFGLGSLGRRGHYQGFQAHQVDLLALEHPFDRRPELEVYQGFLLSKERPGRGGLVDRLRYGSLVGHRLLVKTAQRRERLHFDEEGPAPEEERSLAIAAAVGQGWKDLEDHLFARDIGLYHVFIPAEWRDNRLENDDFQLAVMTAFQSIAQVGKRYYGRLDMSGDPIYRLEMDEEPGGDFLPDGRHLSSRGHAKVGARVARWYLERVVPRSKKR